MTREELNEKNLDIYLNKIKIGPLKKFVEEALLNYGNVKKLSKANKVADIVWQKFEHMEYISSLTQQQFVDITIAACLLHNLFYKENDITTILKHRVVLTPIANECKLDVRFIDMIFEVIESQLGEKHPIQKFKPLPNSPASTFADAVWMIDTYKTRI